MIHVFKTHSVVISSAVGWLLVNIEGDECILTPVGTEGYLIDNDGGNISLEKEEDHATSGVAAPKKEISFDTQRNQLICDEFYLFEKNIFNVLELGFNINIKGDADDKIPTHNLVKWFTLYFAKEDVSILVSSTEVASAYNEYCLANGKTNYPSWSTILCNQGGGFAIPTAEGPRRGGEAGGGGGGGGSEAKRSDTFFFDNAVGVNSLAMTKEKNAKRKAGTKLAQHQPCFAIMSKELHGDQQNSEVMEEILGFQKRSLSRARDPEHEMPCTATYGKRAGRGPVRWLCP
jgi:hypothetical protein